jgi:hypothetical protein
MALNNFCSCVECDVEFTFTALDIDQNCAGQPLLSQVAGLLILPDGATPPTDWTSKADWEAVVNNSATDNTAARYLTGIGGVDVPEKQIIRVAKGVDVLAYRTYQLVLDIFNLSDLNRDFAAALQCNPLNFKFWFETVDGSVFGGSTGISPTFTDADFPLGSGEADLEKATVSIRWRATCEPPRTTIVDLSENFAAVSSAVVVFSDGAGTVFSDGSGTVFTP